MSMGLPGVKVGPLDVDATSGFGQVAATAGARRLLRLHAQMHPPHLRQQLSKPLDAERTKGLDLDEVREYVGGLKHENGDPLVPQGARVVGAQVRGSRDRAQVLTLTYETPSRRTGKWYAPYDADVLPRSFEAGGEFVRVQEMKERGVVAFDESGHENATLRNQLREANRQVKALRAAVEGRDQAGEDEAGAGPVPEGEPFPEVRGTNVLADENERLGRENQEMRERLAQLEQHVASIAEGRLAGGAGELDDRDEQLASELPPDDASRGAQEPVDGYDGLNATDAINLLKSDSVDNDTRQSILDYERTHANRGTVVAAGERVLGRTG